MAILAPPRPSDGNGTRSTSRLWHESEVVVQQGEERGRRAGIVDRMMGAARLQVSTFEDVEADRSATRQAILVVIVVAIATGIGSVGGGVAGLLSGVAFALVG